MNNRIKYLVVFALLVNVATLGFLLFRKPKMPPPPEHILIDALKLNKEQHEKFEILRGGNKQARDTHNAQIAALRRSLYSHWQIADSLQRDSTIAQINLLQRQIEQINWQHFADIRDLCQPEQQIIFDKLMLEVATRSSQKPQPPPKK